jgi:hypothetical protein
MVLLKMGITNQNFQIGQPIMNPDLIPVRFISLGNSTVLRRADFCFLRARPQQDA